MWTILALGVVAHEHAHRFRREPPEMGDLVVGHRDPLAVRALGHGGLPPDAPLGQLAVAVGLPGEEVADADRPRADVRDPVASDLDVRAADAHLDAVIADVLDAAAGDDASLGVVEQQRAGHLDAGLERRGIVGRRLPFRVGEDEALEAEVVDRGAGTPDHPDDLRQARGDDLGRPHVLARTRQEVERPERTIEIPLAGGVQGLDDVLHPVGAGLVAGEEGEQARAVEGDRARLRVDALDRQPVVQPLRDPDDLHVPQVAPAGDDVARGVDEPPGRAPEEVAGIARQRFDPVFALLRQPRPRPAFAVDEELPEPPSPGLHLGDVHRPGPATVDLAPTAAFEAASPAQDHLLARRRGVDHGSVSGPGILGAELQRRVEVIGPGTQDDADGSGSRGS